jgi:hypothetical protein
MKGEIRTFLARRLPGYEVRSVRALGEGLDNAAHEVNGELIVRTSKEADPATRAESIRREAELLAVVARIATLPVPEPVFADPGAGIIAYRRLRRAAGGWAFGAVLASRPVRGGRGHRRIAVWYCAGGA